MRMSTYNERLPSTTSHYPTIPRHLLLPPTTPKHPQAIHMLSTNYINGKFQAILLLFWLGRWVEITRIKGNQVCLDLTELTNWNGAWQYFHSKYYHIWYSRITMNHQPGILHLVLVLVSVWCYW